MEAELEGGDDAEVGTGATDPPEQVGPLVLACPDKTAVGRDELDGGEVVEREAERSLQPADEIGRASCRERVYVLV